jgi:hypothetical protein
MATAKPTKQPSQAQMRRAMGRALHRHYCGSPPSCGRGWESCRDAHIYPHELDVMLAGLRAAGLQVVRRGS